MVLLVDAQDNDGHLFVLAEHLRGMVDPLRPAHVTDVHQAVDTLFDLHEGPEVREVPHDTVHERPHREPLLDSVPGVLPGLLETEGYLALLFADVENDGFDILTDRDDLGGVLYVLRPRHLRDMDQAFDALFQLDECAVVGNAGHFSTDHAPDLVACLYTFPGEWLQLLETQGDPLSLAIELQDLHVDLVTNRHQMRRVLHPAPAHVGDVQQTVDSAQIDEGSEVGDVLDDALANLVLLQFPDQAGLLLRPRFLENLTPAHHYVPAPLVELDHPELELFAYELLQIGNLPQRHLRARKEGIDSHDLDYQTALDPLDNGALEHGSLVIGTLDVGPDLLEVSPLLRDGDPAVRVLQALDVDIDLLPGEYLVPVGELAQGDDPLALVADVDHNLVANLLENGPGHDRSDSHG